LQGEIITSAIRIVPGSSYLKNTNNNSPLSPLILRGAPPSKAPIMTLAPVLGLWRRTDEGGLKRGIRELLCNRFVIILIRDFETFRETSKKSVDKGKGIGCKIHLRVLIANFERG
jgi:hypothetical protein